MAAEIYQKKELLGLMSTGANKLCVDCNAPSPQWASLSHGTFICLECSGIHRGFGVHISFVRSITMDKWSDEQLKKMKVGGNEAFKSFMQSYGPSGGYTKGMGMQEKYQSWAAAQYRDKLSAQCADPPKDWSPSAPPPGWGVPSRPASAQATRKSRAGANASPNLSDSTPNLPSKADNEAFFGRLGSANATRPDHLPPSQGGKYAGFGSSYEPPSTSTSSHPSFSTSSQSVPTLNDIQSDPWKAVSKGWGLFSSAVASAGKEINNSVVQPGMSRAQALADENGGDWRKYLDQVGGQAKTAAGWAGQKAGEGWEGLNGLAKERGGVDLDDHLRKLGLGGRTDGYGELERAEDGILTPLGGGEGAEYPDMAAHESAPLNKQADKGGWDKDDDWKDF